MTNRVKTIQTYYDSVLYICGDYFDYIVKTGSIKKTQSENAVEHEAITYSKLFPLYLILKIVCPLHARLKYGGRINRTLGMK